MDLSFWLLVAFATKHLIVDFLIQNRSSWLWMHKGTYLHPGGITHAAHHALGTFFVVMWPVPSWAFAAAALDFVVHYHIDWAKMRLNAVYGLKSDKDPAFWDLLGLDQYLHSLTYFWLVYLMS